jgi:hypothetical protein
VPEVDARRSPRYFDRLGSTRPRSTRASDCDREALQLYDPGLFGIVEETMAYKGKTDWRLRQ